MWIYIGVAGALALLGAALVTGIRMNHAACDHTVAPYLLILGTTVNDTEPSIMLSERIEGAYRYLVSHPEVICIPTGGKNPDASVTEAQCIANKLMEKGIDESRIWPEHKATTTLENLRFSLELIREKTGSEPACVAFFTSDYHVLRVRMLARRLGLQVYANASKSRHTIFYYPAFLREILAVWYYLLFFK